MKLILFALIAINFVGMAGCQLSAINDPSQTAPEVAGAIKGQASSKLEVSIMTFNVENLFDMTHDEGKNDFTYLPISKKQSESHQLRCNEVPVKKWREQCLYWDWNESVVEYRLVTLARVIKQVNNGRGPDIIAFQEVENTGILRRLSREYLAVSEYLEPILVEGDDSRGIDVAFLSRLPLASTPQLHAIEFEAIEPHREADTRGILQADFRLPDGSVLTGFAVHFPAPFHPFRLRIDAYRSLNKLLDSLPKNRTVFAAGDFNTPFEEDQKQGMLQQWVLPLWRVAHQEGCHQCLGTHYYAPKKEWSFLDMILINRDDHNSRLDWRLDPSKTKVVNRARGQIDDQGFPQGFSIARSVDSDSDGATATSAKELKLGPGGISDHLPLLITLKRGL